MEFRVIRSSQFPDEEPRLDDNFIKEYESISEASRQTGINIMSISCCANKKRKSGGGYLWHFV